MNGCPPTGTTHFKQVLPTSFAHSYNPPTQPIPLPTFCPCCLAAISPLDLTTNLPSSYTMAIEQQSTTTTPIQSQSPAMMPSSLPIQQQQEQREQKQQQQQSAMRALYGLTPEQETILRENTTPPSVMQALELARESEAGATEPTVAKIVIEAYHKIWNKLATRPDLYLMTEHEFAIFNHFQSRWPDKEIAMRAVARYWDNTWAFATPAGRDRS
ncbi:hypothetical protein QBC41DRAFT_354958 [Cercophora samala]|uniref:Uncharacterized protein n=1 Tax=Cercophora samala TaxID=330535 RepID=A0AA40DEC7_9PEZI|nr:hypothetical protein QBC41DRAFT_354958 [Cercophora samala]